MKHAILIMAHKNYSFLHHLIEYFECDCYVFVHIDKKSDITKEQMACLREMPQVAGVYRKYSVHWGGFSILKCELFLLRKAHEACDAEYFHLISGQDYPIKPIDSFLDFFESNNGIDYIVHVHLPNQMFDHNTFERFQFIHLFDFFADRDKARTYSRMIAKWQRKFHLKRRIPDYFDHLYGSSQWFSLRRSSIAVILEYTKRHSGFFNSLKYSFAAEECYISTLVINLLEGQDVNIENCNYRFVRWKYENGNYPANLSIEHFHFLVEDKAFFARKFEGENGSLLVNIIDNYLLCDTHIVYLPNGGWKYKGYRLYCFDQNLLNYLHHLCLRLKAKSIVDIGCGSGIYVAALRRLKIPIAGYDANPFTPELSALLLPANDIPCGIADITDDLGTNETFDLILCIDVLQFIPVHLLDKAIDNLVKLSSKHILIGFSDCASGCGNGLGQKEIKELILHNAFVKDTTSIGNSAKITLKNGKEQILDLFIKQKNV